MKTCKQILLVEHKTEDIEMILAALDEHNLARQVAIARDGMEGLDYLLRRAAFGGRPAGHPSVVLLDLQVPPTGGLSLLREMKARRQLRRIPVVILASTRKQADLRASYELGANAYVVKPGSFCCFIEAIKQVGAFWTRLNEVPAKSDCRAQTPRKGKSSISRRLSFQRNAA